MNVSMNPHFNFDDSPPIDVGEIQGTRDYFSSEDFAAQAAVIRANLKGKHASIRNLLTDQWTSVEEVARILGMSITNTTGRIRELRTEQYGSYKVHCRRVMDSRTFEYRINSDE